MSDGGNTGTPLDELVSEELSGITFVRDYVQFQFGSPPTLNAYAPITIRNERGTLRTGAPGFADALVAQVNKQVDEVAKHESRSLVLMFTDGTSIEISLRPEDYECAEAFEYLGRQGAVVVE